MKPQSAHRPHIDFVPAHRDRNIIAAVCVVVGLFGIWAIALAFGRRGAIDETVNTCTTLLVILAPLVVLTAVYGWAGVVEAFTWIVRPSQPSEAVRDAATCFQLAAAFSLGFGFVGTVLGLVITLTNLQHPRELGPNLALTLVSQFEGVLLATLYLAASARVTRRHAGVVMLSPLARRTAGVAGATIIAGTLTTLVAFFILRLSVCPAL